MPQNNKPAGIVISVASLIMVILFVALVVQSVMDNPTTDCSDTTESSTQSLLTSSTSTLSPIGQGISSSSVTGKNQTWLEFDGDDDYVLSNRYDTISFWYKNSTINWTFMVNSSGTLYVNGSLRTPEVYPIYDNGSNMFIGKTDALTYFNGSIDDFRGYNSSIDANLVNLTYLGGRL